MKIAMPTDAQMDAMKRGKEAFRRESPLNANPYPTSSKLYDFWMFGWVSIQVDKRDAEQVNKIPAPKQIQRGAKNE